MKMKNSFSKYFAEFLVIFIAVFMGFLAENLRENTSEKKKELMLMRSLLSDLRNDTIHIKSIIEENQRKHLALDSFINIRHHDFSQQSNLELFFTRFKAIEMWSAIYFEPTMTTLNQLKSTGVLSSADPILAAAIADYDVNLEKNKFDSENYYKHVEETFRMIYGITDYIVLWNNPPENPALMTDDITLMKFFNLSADLMYTIDGYIGDLGNLSIKIRELITLIEAEYE